MFPLILLFLETFFLYLLYRKFGVRNGILLVYLIVYFYCNSIVFEMFLLSNSKIIQDSFVNINRDTNAFDLSIFCYFLFLVTYFFLFYFVYKDFSLNKPKIFLRISNKILIYIAIIFIIYFIFNNSQSTRATLKETSGILTTVLNWYILFCWAYMIFCARGLSKQFMIAYSILTIIYSIFSFEREPIVFVSIVLLIRFYKNVNISYLVIGGILGLFVLNYFKAFYLIVLGGIGFEAFIEYVQSNPLTLSKLDPIASFNLLYDYFNSKPSFYNNYDFTYITSFVDQFNRYILSENDVGSISKIASKHYVGNQYGVAFSMILESILNFSYFGPVILAYLAYIIYSFLKKRFYYLNETIDIVFVMFFLSFIRTELIVMSKIYTLPVIVFLIATRIYYTKKNILKKHLT